MNALFRRKLILALIPLTTALALVLANHDNANAYASIKLTGAATAAPTGIAVRWDLDNPNSRANIANRRIRYVIGDSGTRYHSSLTGPYDEFRAIQKSFNVWRDLRRSDIDFEFAGTTNTPSSNANDAQNTVYWAQSGIDPSVFAETTTSFDTTTGEIVDADLVFNDALNSGVGFVWDTIGFDATSGSPGKTYVETIAVHEIGHFLGLDHSILASSSLYPFARQGAISLMTLDHDDAAPISASHPETRYPIESYATISGSVRAAGVGRLGVAVSLIDIASGEPIMSVLSDRQTTRTSVGDFTFEDVPPGAYWIVATPSPTGIYGSYYAAPYTAFLPTFFGVTPAAAGTPQVVRVSEGDTLNSVNITIANATSPFENNDSAANATSLSAGQGVGARLEDASDEDYFSVMLAGGATLNVRVHAAMLSSDLNPTLTLFDSDGTTVITTGDFGATNFDQDARDIQFDDYLVAAQNQDCRFSYTNPNASTAKQIYFVVKGTGGAGASSGADGDYLLSTWSTTSFSGVDQTQSTITADILGGTPSGSAFTVNVVPRTTGDAQIANSTSLYVELIDVSNNSTVIDMQTGNGPWTFTVNRPGVAGEKIYAARVGANSTSATTLDQRLTLSFADAVDAGQSAVVTLSQSLVRDGEDATEVEIYLRDAAGNDIVDATHTVTLQNTGGTVSTPVFDSERGIWTATLTAPSSGTGITITAIADSITIGTASVALLGVAASEGLPVITKKKDKGGGGCAIASTARDSLWLMLSLALLALGVMLSPRRLAGSRRVQ